MPFSEKNPDNEPSPGFNYGFSEEEIKLLARLLRNNQSEIPPGLEIFSRKVELYIYNLMTIDEVEKFYGDRNL